MKLLKTIKKIIKEAEEQYNIGCENNLPIDELNRLEKNYIDSLKLLKFFEDKNKKTKSK